MEIRKKLCPHCGKENDEDNLFCGYCGKSLSSTEVIAEKNEDNADIDEEAQAIESILEIHPRKLNLKINPIRFSLIYNNTRCLFYFTIGCEAQRRNKSRFR